MNDLIYALTQISKRREAVRALRERLGASGLYAFVRDDGLDAHVAAQHFPELPATLEPSVHALVSACVQVGIVHGKVSVEGGEQPATAIPIHPACVVVVVGAEPAFDESAQVALGTIGALFVAEHAALAAERRADSALEAARLASALTHDLEVTRNDLRQALDEAARLNSELMHAADRERVARAKAESADRAKDEFLAMLGHELRNPLAPIVTALELLRQGGQRGSREYEIIARQIGHVVRLVDDLLDVSRITRGKVELSRLPIEASAIVHRAVEMASPLFEQRAQHLEVSVPIEGLLLEADEGRLAQVVSNLLTNAAKYTPVGGAIALTAYRDDEDVVIAVRDSGVGIEASMIPKIFDLFVQGERARDRAEGGLGLGLALVQNLVSMHGGTVSVESEGRNRGSTFTIRLRALPADMFVEPVTSRFDPLEPRASGPTKRVLIVDDNSDAVELLSIAVKRQGHRVATAHDGPTALEMVDAFRPDVAILDLGLPVMDGFELAKKLRANETTRDARLIAVTGYGQETDRSQSKAAGFDAHLVKPVDLQELFIQLSMQHEAVL